MDIQVRGVGESLLIQYIQHRQKMHVTEHWEGKKKAICVYRISQLYKKPERKSHSSTPSKSKSGGSKNSDCATGSGNDMDD
jgi:hypothetical protein